MEKRSTLPLAALMFVMMNPAESSAAPNAAAPEIRASASPIARAEMIDAVPISAVPSVILTGGAVDSHMPAAAAVVGDRDDAALPAMPFAAAEAKPNKLHATASPATARALPSQAAGEPAPVASAAIGDPLFDGAAPAKAGSDPVAMSGARPWKGERLSFPKDSPLAEVKIRELLPGIFFLRFPEQRLMAKTFIRYQEFYESPKFRGKVFTVAQFMRWYKGTKQNGGRDYYDYWDGFNIPSRVLRRFKNGDFDPLSDKEKAILSVFGPRKGKFYLIATAEKGGEPSTFRHEIAHGLYATHPEYRRRAQEILKSVDLGPIYKLFVKLGYNRSVWLDEAHAYITAPLRILKEEGVADTRPYRDVHTRLLALYKEYAPKY